MPSTRDHAAEAPAGAEHYYQTLFEKAEVAFCVIEVLYDAAGAACDYRLLDLNPAFERHTGIADARGKTAREVAPGIEPEWFARYGRVAATGEPARFEQEARAQNRWYDVSAFRVGAPDARTVAVVFTDVTERRRSDERLREQQSRLRALFENVAIGIAEVDMQGRIQSVNERFGDLLGYRPAEVVGMTIHEFTAPEDRARTRELNDQINRGDRESLDYEKRYVKRDGTPLWVHVTVSGIRGADGRVVRAVGTIEDISERKRAEDALRASEERWRAVMDNLSEGLMLFDAAGSLIYQNPASLRIHGFDPDAPKPKERDELAATWLAWDEAGELVKPDAWPMSRVYREGRFQNQVLHVRRVETGAEFWASYNGCPILGADGKIAFGFITIREITEELRARRGLQAANARLQDADRRKDEFLAVLSHELRNPLSPVTNSIYILGRTVPGSEQARRAVEVIGRQVTYMTRLVDDLLDVTRISRGKVRLQPELIDLNEVARRAGEDVREVFRAAGVALDIAADGVPLPACADRVRVAQIIGNLLHNAAKFTPAGGRVTLTAARAEGNTARVSVRDDGLGIEPGLLGRLFEPFVQADASIDRSKGGLGLGLALARGLVELHGGHIRVHSEGLGKGTEFTVDLPLRPCA